MSTEVRIIEVVETQPLLSVVSSAATPINGPQQPKQLHEEEEKQEEEEKDYSQRNMLICVGAVVAVLVVVAASVLCWWLFFRTTSHDPSAPSYPSFCEYTAEVSDTIFFDPAWSRPNVTMTYTLLARGTSMNAKFQSLGDHFTTPSAGSRTIYINEQSGILTATPFFNRTICTIQPTSSTSVSGLICFAVDKSWEFKGNTIPCPMKKVCGTLCSKYTLTTPNVDLYMWFSADEGTANRPCQRVVVDKQSQMGSLMVVKKWNSNKPSTSLFTFDTPTGALECTDLRQLRTGPSADRVAESEFVVTDEKIEEINRVQQSWKAVKNEAFEGVTYAEFKSRLLGSSSVFHPHSLVGPLDRPTAFATENSLIPEQFDVRIAWPQCSRLMKQIYNQGTCGSCWAWSGRKTLESRFCIATNVSQSLSALQMVSCFQDQFNCQGGFIDTLWRDFHTQGAVLESNFSTTPIPQACSSAEAALRFKVGSYYPVSLNSTDKKANVKAIQMEIMRHGPVQAGMTVFDDLAGFGYGVYKPIVSAKVQGGHAVTITGWGKTTTAGEEYWIVDNSWGNKWGDNGRFFIARGSNTCGIESQVAAGIPLI